MPKDFSRIDRVQDLMQRELALLIQQNIKDPRVGMITVTDVVASKDLKYAKVYVTVLDESGAKESVQVLNRAAGFLRSALAKKIQIRTIPALKFIFDDTTIRANHISRIIDAAILQDKQSISRDSVSRDIDGQS
tara:strand:- start:12467 stop:12868 length:402 start_codon:yes stop_codon:yes gene_type:complete